MFDVTFQFLSCVLMMRVRSEMCVRMRTLNVVLDSVNVERDIFNIMLDVVRNGL